MHHVSRLPPSFSERRKSYIDREGKYRVIGDPVCCLSSFALGPHQKVFTESRMRSSAFQRSCQCRRVPAGRCRRDAEAVTTDNATLFCSSDYLNFYVAICSTGSPLDPVYPTRESLGDFREAYLEEAFRLVRKSWKASEREASIEKSIMNIEKCQRRRLQYFRVSPHGADWRTLHGPSRRRR